MLIANSDMFSMFEKPPNNAFATTNVQTVQDDKANTKTDMYVGTGIVAGTTIVGAAAGYGLYCKEKNNLKLALNKAEATPISSNIAHLLDKLKAAFADILLREKEGKPASFNNCIMLVGEDPELNNRLIKWAGENSEARFIEINHKDSLVAQLREAGKIFREKSIRSLISIDGFDKLLDHSITTDQTIESLKSIMSATAENYHSTIIFGATNPLTLDKIALEPHRVKRIDVNINKSEFDVIEAVTKNIQHLKEKLGQLPKTRKILLGSVIGLVIGAVVLGVKQFLFTRTNNNS